MSDTVSRSLIADCEAVIRPYIRRTPLLELDGRDVGLEVERLRLKLELFQRSGSFKARGAFANLLMRDLPSAGVVAASGGNHGAAVGRVLAGLQHVGGDPGRIQSFLDALARDTRIVRNPQKIATVRPNAIYIQDLARENGSAGSFFANWPAGDQLEESGPEAGVPRDVLGAVIAEHDLDPRQSVPGWPADRLLRPAEELRRSPARGGQREPRERPDDPGPPAKAAESWLHQNDLLNVIIA